MPYQGPGNSWTWVEGGQYFGSLIPGPNGIPPAATQVTDVLSTSSLDASVEDNAVPPQINPGPGNYQQPDTAARETPGVSVGGTMVVNQIEAAEGVNYTQPNTAAPAANPEIGVPTLNRNPMGL